jgi:hypothetical protein
LGLTRLRRNRDEQAEATEAGRAFPEESSKEDELFRDSISVSLPDCAGKEWFACGDQPSFEPVPKGNRGCNREE